MKKPVKNKLIIVGTGQQVRDVREYLTRVTSTDEELSYIDFNGIVKMPSSLKINYDTNVDLTRQILYSESIEFGGAPEDELWEMYCDMQKSEQENCIQQAVRIQDNLEVTGHAYWETWAKKYWGTESNAYDQRLEANNIIEFRTDGYPATKIIKKLASLFPDVELIHKYTIEEFYNPTNSNEVHFEELDLASN